ncbi:Ig-like domain-containing protein [Flavobacteriaceae bacterium]|mgnify:CR=1 FL=1|nr:Ig-like domain-containing protein [Flavobacteriaceae bacterium]MDB4228249.1 Ig-like domain-containing protein [Flavobacteriaceae bacterium]
MQKIVSIFLILVTTVGFSQTDVSGALSSDTTWSLSNSPIILTGNVLVPNGVTLTIEAGVTVRINSEKYLKVQGSLIAIGTESNKIIFTSNESSPAKGDWDKIWLASTSTSFDGSDNYVSGTIFNHCIISYADEGLRLDDSSFYLVNSELTENNKGINFRKVINSVIDNNNFNNNGSGTSTSAGTEDNGIGSFTFTKFLNNTFKNNTGDGLSFGGYRNNANNNLIKNNISINNGGNGFYFGWGDVVRGFADNTIDGNIIYNNSGNGITVGRDSNIIKKNFIVNNEGSGINISGTYIYEGLTIENNIISGNLGYGLDLTSNTNSLIRYNSILNSGGNSENPSLGIPNSYIISNNNTITYNTIYASENSAIELRYGPNTFNNNNFISTKGNYIFKLLTENNSDINAENNYWGTSTESEIQSVIYDNSDDFELGAVEYTPFLTSPNTDAPISPPSNVTKQASGSDIVLSWSANGETDIAGYKLHYGSPTGYSYSTTLDLGNVTTYTVTGGDITTEYSITAYDSSIDGTDDMVDGNESWFSKANTLPELSTNIVLEGVPRKSKLSWTLSASDNIAYYEVFRGLSASPTDLLYTTSSEAENNYIDDGLTVGETYYYRIKVVDTDGTSSDFSDDFSVTIPTSWVVSKEIGSENGFGSTENPFINIQDAVDETINDDIILVSPGTYQENILIDEKVITVTTPSPLESAETTIIDGGANGIPVVIIQGEYGENYVSNSDLQFSGFTLQNGFSATSDQGAGITVFEFSSVVNLKNLIIKNNTSSNDAAGSYFYYTGNVFVTDVVYENNSGNYTFRGFNSPFEMTRTEFYENSATSQVVKYSQNQTNHRPLITNSIIRNNTSSGALDVMNLNTFNTTIVNNGSQNLFSDNCAIINSIISSGQFISLSTSGGILEIQNSLIEDGESSVSILPAFLTYENNLEGDIYFNDVMNSDYTLSEYSPAIGSGINSINLYTIDYNLESYLDLNSGARPLPEGTNIDIGAYENSLGANNHNSDIYVSINDGSNDGSVGLEAAPFQTIQAAINYALNDDTIYVLPGEYPGGSTIINKGINFISTTSLGAIVNNNVNGSNTFTFSSNTGVFYSTITGFDLNKTSTGQAYGIRATNSHYVNIYKSKISNFTSATSTGVSAIQAENCLFINNGLTIYNDQCSTGSENITPRLKNCTVINSGSIHNACSTISLDVINSIVLISDTDQNAYTSPPNFNKVITNDANIIPQENSTWEVAPDQEVDIYFTDFTNGDYSLQDFSPAIGYGYFPVNEDINGGTRPLPVGSSLDIGAYENALGSPLNGSPRFDAIADVSANEDSGIQSFDILNVVDGDILETQALSFSVATDNDELFESININYTQGNGAAVLNYTPALDQNGTANITVTLNDDSGTEGGGIDNVTKTFVITISPVNDQPIVTDHTLLVDEGTTVVTLGNNEVNLLYNAVDEDQDELTAILVTQPTNGSITLNIDGTFSYTHDSSETISDSFTYKANDNSVDSEIATVTITVSPVNDAPVVSDHLIQVDEGGIAIVLDNSETSVLYNASDIEEDSFTAILETVPAHGILVLDTDGTFSYTHDGSDTLTDSFTYRADDSNLTSEIGTVSIIINPDNDNAPTDINLSNNLINENIDSANGYIIGQFTTIDLDLPSDTHTFEFVSGDGDTDNNSFVIDGNNLKTFTSFDFETQSSFSIRVITTDGETQSFEKSFTIDIANIGDISISSELTNSYCEGDTANGSITISTITDTTGDLVFSWSASNGGSIPIGQENDQNLTDLKDGTYTFVVSDATDFILTEEFQINLTDQYSDLSVCYVSSDENEPTKNRVFINNQGNYNVSVYEVLRETSVTGNYEVIGTMNSDDISFLDEESNNQVQTYSYKVRLVDLCGDVSEDSSLHKTILLQSSISVTNSVNLSWTDYEGTDYSTYKIYRSVDNGDFEELGSVSSSNTSYNDEDATVISGSSYEYYISIAVDQCNFDQGKNEQFNTVELKSNRLLITDGTASVDDFNNLNQFKIYPNPAEEILNIKLSDGINFIRGDVYNSIGQLILKTKEMNFSIKNLPPSIYFIKIYSSKGVISRSFIKK